jgi:hypothetical protein
MRTGRPAERAHNSADRGGDDVMLRARGRMSGICDQPPRLFKAGGDRTIGELAYRLLLRLRQRGNIHSLSGLSIEK